MKLVGLDPPIYKIGHISNTERLEKHLRMVNEYSAHDAKVIATVRRANVDITGQIKEMFDFYCRKGEWFDSEEPVVALVRFIEQYPDLTGPQLLKRAKQIIWEYESGDPEDEPDGKWHTTVLPPHSRDEIRHMMKLRRQATTGKGKKKK